MKDWLYFGEANMKISLIPIQNPCREIDMKYSQCIIPWKKLYNETNSITFLENSAKTSKKSNERLLRFISAAFVTHTLGDFQIEGYDIYRDIDKYDINVECEESSIRGQSYIIKTSFFASNELFIVSNDCTKIFIARYNNAVKVHKQFADIFRDIIPFGTPPKLKLNGPICQIAHAIYHDNDFDSLPILADALGELDNDQEIINDCRLQRKRYKGYWLVDYIIRKR